MTRLCALPDCDEPMVRRPGEKPSVFADRRACCSQHSRKLAALAITGNKAGSKKWDSGGLSNRMAAAVLSRIPPRLLWQFEELPPAERQKALEGWRV